eukprot:Clim_evm42s227 gene=Clim_evmTU42s227
MNEFLLIKMVAASLAATYLLHFLVESSWFDGVLVGAVCMFLLSFEPAAVKVDERNQDRKMSFVSDFLAKGFPKELDVPYFPVNGVLYFEKLPEYEKLCEMLEARALYYKRLRSRLGYDKDGNPHWRPVEVKIADHVNQLVVKSDAKRLEEQNRLLLAPFEDMDNRPPWDCWMIENAGEGPSAVLFRFHHAIGDGISLLQVFMNMATDESGEKIDIPTFSRATKAGPGNTGGWLMTSYLSAASRVAGALVKIAAVPVTSPDSPTVFKHLNESNWHFTGKRQLVEADSVSLAKIKAVKNKHSCTVNDVMSAVLAGTVRKFMEKRKDPELEKGDKLKVRCVVPYAFPRKTGSDETDVLHNKWCFISLDLPVHLESPVERIRACKQILDAIKASPEAYLQLKINEGAGRILPFNMTAQTARDLMLKHTFCFTNVPGPSETVYLCGTPVDNVTVQVANSVHQVDVLSYNGKVNFNVVLDNAEIENPQELKDAYHEALQEILAC